MMQVRIPLPTTMYRTLDHTAWVTRNARIADGLAHRTESPERVELGHWLRNAKMPFGTMDLVTLEGFLTALVVGPAIPATEDWLPQIWARRPPRRAPACLRAPAAYTRFRELVLRYHAEIARQFDDSPESFQPTFCTAQFGGVASMIVDPWCIGFVARMETRRRSWRPLEKECPDLLRPIQIYGTRTGWEERHQANDPATFHAEWWPQIAPAVQGIHRYWLARKRISGMQIRLSAG